MNDNEAICRAVMNNKYDVVVYLHQCGIDLIFKNNILMCYAAQYADINMIKYLAANGVDPCARRDYPICLASERNNNIEMIKFLIKNGANVSANNNQPIIASSKYGNLNLVKYLIKKGADYKARKNRAVYEAINYGHLQIVKYFHECGFEFIENDNYKLLIAAIKNKHCKMISYIIKNSNIDDVDNLSLMLTDLLGVKYPFNNDNIKATHLIQWCHKLGQFTNLQKYIGCLNKDEKENNKIDDIYSVLPGFNNDNCENADDKKKSKKSKKMDCESILD